MRGKGDAETRYDGERRRLSGEKRGEGDVPVGSQAPNNLTADWLKSFHSPAAAPICCCCYCAGVFVHLYYCACVKESKGGWETVEVGSKCLRV